MTAYRLYKYVGSNNIKGEVPENPERYLIQSADNVLEWITSTQQQFEDNQVVATFIIDTDGNLYINDRRSEHVRCAAGGSVLSAGEITFRIHKKQVEIVEITNQSTGYCPEPESWQAVDIFLSKLKIPYPPDFTHQFIFRLCDQCGTRNLVKDDWFYCGVCDSPLSTVWNFE